MKTKCIIIDDEPLAIEALTALLEKFPDMDIVETCRDSFQAFEVLQKKKVDLMFLDIQMPEVTGLSFVKSLQRPPKVILTTAYRQYALEAFDLDVVDYLLKPISLERLMKAINKYYKLADSGEQLLKPKETTGETVSDHIFVRADRKHVKVFFQDILYIEGLKDYVRIVTLNGNILPKLSLNQLETDLSENNFLRIHRSYIINLSKVTAFTSRFVEIDKWELPIGGSYRNMVLNLLGGRNEG